MSAKRLVCVSPTPGLTRGQSYIGVAVEWWGTNMLLVVTDDDGFDRGYWIWRFEVIDGLS